jgi:hypothetical protein
MPDALNDTTKENTIAVLPAIRHVLTVLAAKFDVDTSIEALDAGDLDTAAQQLCCRSACGRCAVCCCHGEWIALDILTQSMTLGISSLRDLRDTCKMLHRSGNWPDLVITLIADGTSPTDALDLAERI